MMTSTSRNCRKIKNSDSIPTPRCFRSGHCYGFLPTAALSIPKIKGKYMDFLRLIW